MVDWREYREALRGTMALRVFVYGFRFGLLGITIGLLSGAFASIKFTASWTIPVFLGGFAIGGVGVILSITGTIAIKLRVGPGPEDPIALGAYLLASIFRSDP